MTLLGRKIMKRKRFYILCCWLLCFLLFSPGVSAGAEESFQEDLYGKSGAEELYNGLDQEAKELLSQAGVDSGLVGPGFQGEDLFQLLSRMLREKLAGPLKALASLTAAAVLCRLACCLGNGEAGEAAALAGALACAAVVAVPLLELLRAAQRAVESASVFLLAAVPVYGALMAASGSPAAGTSYSFLTLAAGNVIPVLSSVVVFPLVRVFLALSLASSVSQVKFDRLAGSLYGFAKWLMVLTVTAFSGVLSVQTALNAQVDAATNKAAKLVASTAIPIVGGAFGDAVAAIQNSVHIVKSGVGAFGILAALCIFAPAAVEAALWSAVCGAGRIVCDLFEAPKLSAFLGACASSAKMILAVIASVCAVCVVSAAILLFLRGSL